MKTLLVLDVDGTMYPKDITGEAYLTEGKSNEDKAIAERLAMPIEDVVRTFEANKDKKTRSAVVAEIFSLPAEWWNEIRIHCYEPEKYFSSDPVLVHAIGELVARYDIVFATNNPAMVGYRVLKALGFGDLIDSGATKVIGPDEVGAHKPSAKYFANVAKLFKRHPSGCVSIGDREDADYFPALEAGMKALLIENREDLLEIIKYFRQTSGNFNVVKEASAIVHSVLASGEIRTLGITGQAGAGKTTSSQNILEIAEEMGCPVIRIELDWYFILSSKQRKAWLSESDDPHRRDQRSWWNTRQLAADLTKIKNRETIHYRGIYNRGDGGELNGTKSLDIPSTGGVLIVVEGVGLLHEPSLVKQIDIIWALYAPRVVRKKRLFTRDINRRPNPVEAHERFLLTEAFEVPYFDRFGHLASKKIYGFSNSLYI